MKRVVVTLVSLGLIAGMAALVPLLAGEPAAAATPCASQHRHVVAAQRKVRHQKAELAKDRRHHQAKAVRKDRKKLTAAKRKAHSAKLRYRLCQANHKPAKTVTASPSPSDSTSGAPAGLPTSPAELCTLFGQPADCLGTATAVPTDPTAVCSLLMQPTDCLTSIPTGVPTTIPTTSTGLPTDSAALPEWLTSLYPGGDVPQSVIDALIGQYGSVPQVQPANLCSILSGLTAGLLPALCLPDIPDLPIL